jgi:uncharacterized phiE125 gp8 family phage protein
MHWLAPEVAVAPTFDPVALALAKAGQGIETDEHDALLTGYLQAAVAHVEGVTGLRLARQTVKLRAWGFECGWFPLPIAPVAAVTAIDYLDTVGVSQTLDAALYTTALYGLSPLIARAPGQSWPATRCTPGAVTITATVGYADGELPAVLRQAVLLLFGDFNANRERTAPGVVSDIAAVALDALLVNWRLNA